MSVVINGVTYPLVDPGTDNGFLDAIERARVLNRSSLGPMVNNAIIAMDGGLLLLRGPIALMHFTTPSCGYVGTGTDTSAIILEIFGFGTYDTLRDLLSEHRYLPLKRVFKLPSERVN